MMTLKQFRYLSDCYGADLYRWPQADRGSAEMLLAASPQARNILLEQEGVDAIVAHAFDVQQREHVARSADEDTHAALARLRAGVAGRIAAQNDTRARTHGGWRISSARPALPLVWATTMDNVIALRRAGLVFGCAFTVASGLWLGWMQSSSGPVDLLNALLMVPVSGGGS